MEALSPKRTEFALSLAQGMTQREAYKKAFGTTNTRTADSNAHKLAKDPKIQELKEAAEIDIQETLKERASEMLMVQYELVMDHSTPANVRLQATKDWLDRAGYSSTHKVENTKKLEFGKSQMSESEREEVKRLLDQV